MMLRQVPIEIAFAGAIGLMAGICGRAYNFSGTGLNQYVLLLAKTGMGKEGMASGIDKLMDAVKFKSPTASNFIGPSEIASGPALIKHLNKNKCCVSILGEFGLRLQRMSSEHAPAHEKTIKDILLKIYQKSGASNIYRPTIYADENKNINNTESPSFTILGESTPFSFYQSLTEEMISEGLLPRFLLIEYDGLRTILNENNILPNDFLIDRFATLTSYCSQLMHENKVVNAEFTPDAKRMSMEFDEYTTSTINQSNDEVTLHLWNRAHLKALKLAASITVGVNYISPVITKENLDYSIRMICNDVRKLSDKFKKGAVGKSTNETSQITILKKLIKEFYTTDCLQAKTYEKFVLINL